MVDRKRLELLFSTCKADVIPPILTAHKLFGELYEDRTHTSGITTRGADHYTNNSIEIWLRNLGSNQAHS